MDKKKLLEIATAIMDGKTLVMYEPKLTDDLQTDIVKVIVTQIVITDFGDFILLDSFGNRHNPYTMYFTQLGACESLLNECHKRMDKFEAKIKELEDLEDKL